MKLHRFYFEGEIPEKGEITISSSEFIHQLKNVFRFKSGERVILFNNSGFDFLASIENFEKETVTFLILKKSKNEVVPTREVYLFASILKKDNFEWVVEKATELGVAHIIPVISACTEKKDINEERLRKIIIEASEQSGRGTIPTLHEKVSLEEALEKYIEIKSIAFEIASDKFKKEELEETRRIYIGPEGGWTDEELELFKKNNVSLKSLGPQVLRAETAVIAALAQIVF